MQKKPPPPQCRLRAPDQVMRLARMGASFPTRLSFMRVLLRRLSIEDAQLRRDVWQIGEDGFGRAVYSVVLGGYRYSLVVFSTKLRDEDRSDRVIATAWDASFVLFDGTPTTADLDRLEAEVPKQEAGRCRPTELVLARANRSVRLFDHVITALAAGRQPDPDLLRQIGYLMRTTAVYGNGKFGIADRSRISDRPGLSGPFQAEMLAVWMMREFTFDLVAHSAAQRSVNAARLDRDTQRNLGIGNATGLGMAPFLVNHPALIHNWVHARETALARVCALEHPTSAAIGRVLMLIERASAHLEEWQIGDSALTARNDVLRREWRDLQQVVTRRWLEQPNPWAALIQLSQHWGLDCQELLAALLIEPYGALVDDLAATMKADEHSAIDAGMRAGQLQDLLEQNYKWALEVDFSDPQSQHHFWYVSETKLEPRLGLRTQEPGAELESPLDIARQAAALHGTLRATPRKTTLAQVMARHPEHRAIALRIQTGAQMPYFEIRDNTIGADLVPVDMLRFKLAFFGASKFDPKSDRWTRITMYQGAPTAQDLQDGFGDDWWLPVLGARP